MIRVAALDDYQGVALKKGDWSKLPADTDVTSFGDHIDDRDALVARLEPFDVIVAMRERTPFPRSLVERLPNLKLLITTGARNASFDLVALKERGVTVCATGSLSSPTAELAWGLIIGLLRHIAEEDANVRAGGWQRTIGPSLAGATLGCLGLGNLGSQVAKVGKAFDMDVIAWSQNLTAERAAEAGARLVTKEELFAQSDVVTVHLVLSDRSRGLVGASEFALMKPGAYIVNTSRGPIVDEGALVDALRSRRIGGAALDVFDIEPLPGNHALRSLPNTLITPHLGYVTDEGYDIFYRDAVEDILAWLAGSPVRQLA